MPLKFPAFRHFEAMRITANDSMMAILIGIRLAGASLAAVSSNREHERLPELFPDVPDVNRMNRSAADTVDLLGHAERELAYLGIPFALSIYQTFTVQAIRLLRRDGIDSETRNPSLIPLDEVHKYLMDVSGMDFPGRELRLFDVIRQTRNRIIHYGAAPGANLRETYLRLPPSDRALWRKLAGHEFVLKGGPLMQLAASDLTPALAVTKRLSRIVNSELAKVLSRELWATIIVEDYRDSHPSRFREKAQQLRRVRGYASHFYGELQLTEEELRSALDSA